MGKRLKKSITKGKITMKKMINISMIYFIFAMIGGVFYREFTKYMMFYGKTTLSVVHVYLLALGTMLFLILALFCKDTELEQNDYFKRFLLLYNISLPLMVAMLVCRGIVQVMEITLSKAEYSAISGIAGVAHIFLTVAFVFLFLALKKIAK